MKADCCSEEEERGCQCRLGRQLLVALLAARGGGRELLPRQWGRVESGAARYRLQRRTGSGKVRGCRAVGDDEVEADIQGWTAATILNKWKRELAGVRVRVRVTCDEGASRRKARCWVLGAAVSCGPPPWCSLLLEGAGCGSVGVCSALS